jgi:hypothetical protein
MQGMSLQIIFVEIIKDCSKLQRIEEFGFHKNNFRIMSLPISGEPVVEMPATGTIEKEAEADKIKCNERSDTNKVHLSDAKPPNASPPLTSLTVDPMSSYLIDE